MIKKKALVELLDQRTFVGNMMANLCFNLKQRPGSVLTEDICESMSDLQEKWDTLGKG